MRKTFETSDGATLSYIDKGSGDVLILLHGWSQSADMFRHQVEHFSKDRRVIGLDFRGHGKSPDAAHGYRIYRLSADVSELLDHEKIDRASMLGWSMGTSVLWGYIDLFGTSRLDKLVFVDEPASVMRQPGMSDEDAVNAGALFDGATMLSIAEQIAGPEGHAARSSFLDGMITKTIEEDVKAFLLQENLRVAPKDVAALFVNHCTIDWSEIFRRIDLPTLIIGGKVSHVDARSQEWIHGQMKNSELVIFEAHEGGAHFPFIEAPDSFNATLERFLKA
ncbi:alpha/beta hydrolase [Corticibacterium sp. UT-5YL-CI-8]|nr:alpha/beta hydrolase [Tianweitania sp. UT-5YL-CI-8]